MGSYDLVSYNPGVFKHNFDCPKTISQPYPLNESLPYLWQCIKGFSDSHCKNACAFCTSKYDVFTYQPEIHEGIFIELHTAFSHLPQHHQDHLFTETEFGCPACAILNAMQCFPAIVYYSDPKPIHERAIFEDGEYLIKKSTPCFPDFLDNVTGISALEQFDFSSLLILPPPLQHQVRPLITNGQEVIRYVQNLRKNGEPTPFQQSEEKTTESEYGLSDQDVYYIFGVFPEDFDREIPTFKFMEWVKSEIFNNNSDYCQDYQYLERIVRISYYFENCTKSKALLFDRVRASFINAWAACNKNASDYSFRKMLNNGIRHAYLHIRGEGTPEARITFSFAGRKRWFNGEPPSTFKTLPQGCIPDLHPSSDNKTAQVQSGDVKSVSISHANTKSASLGMGMGGDAKAINAPIIAPEDNSIQTIDFKEGALQNNSTVNVAGQGDVVKETRETVFMALEWAKENPSVVLGAVKARNVKVTGGGTHKDDNGNQEKADATLWADWQKARDANISKTEFAVDKDMTVGEVQN
ncbi:MAG: hypothetical protein LUD38_14290, partial [Parabacteroides sp.]|nr:hypothetical protein [Parabacteroides sp.]